MHLAPPEDREPLRLRISLSGATKRDFEAFREYYAHFYGEPIAEEDLLVQLAAHAMQSDAGFKRWRRKRLAVERAESRRRPRKGETTDEKPAPS